MDHASLWRVWAGWGNTTATHRQLYVWNSPSLSCVAKLATPILIEGAIEAERGGELAEESEPDGEVELASNSDEEGELASLSHDVPQSCGCLDSCVCGTDWTPEAGGVWEGETPPSSLLEALARMQPGEQLILATAGSVRHRVQHLSSGPELVADMGVGWTLSAGTVAPDGCNVREIIARGHMGVLTPTGGVASASLAWTCAVGAGLRALAMARPLPPSCSLLIAVAQEQEKKAFCERMLGDSKATRDSPARCWWPELRRHLYAWQSHERRWSMQAMAKPAVGAEHRHWDQYQRLVEAARRQASKGALSSTIMAPLETDLMGIPGGRWYYRDGSEITAGLKKAFLAYAAKLAREGYMQARLEKKRVHLGLSFEDLGVTVGASLTSAGVRWDDRIWRVRGGRGRVDYRSVYRLKLWWNHNGSGEVITRSIRAQVDKTAARLARFPVQDLTLECRPWDSSILKMLQP